MSIKLSTLKAKIKNMNAFQLANYCRRSMRLKKQDLIDLLEEVGCYGCDSFTYKEIVYHNIDEIKDIIIELAEESI